MQSGSAVDLLPVSHDHAAVHGLVVRLSVASAFFAAGSGRASRLMEPAALGLVGPAGQDRWEEWPSPSRWLLFHPSIVAQNNSRLPIDCAR